MRLSSRLRTYAVLATLALTFGWSPSGGKAVAQPAPSPSTPTAGPVAGASPQEPDESVLGTVQVTGGAAAALPKLAVVPLVTTIDADTTTQLVVRKDLDLSGQFDVVDENDAPKGVSFHETPVDAAAWKARGVSIVVKTLANGLPSGKIEIIGEAYLVNQSKDPVFTHRIESAAAKVRESAHRMTDALLGALTGRAGGFASHLVFSGRVGKSRQIFGIDADGFNLHTESPSGDVALAPSFGPSGEVFYALSKDYSPFGLVHGKRAVPVPLTLPGSVFGIAFNSDKTKLALAIAAEAASKIYVGNVDGSSLLPVATTALLANHPAFGPNGKLAYVAGGPAGQRVFVDGKAISPAGFNASAPAFCDTPDGLLVVFTVGVGKGADLVATDIRGGSIRRITQNQGANSYPACSPDGRLLAYFSTRKTEKGPGIYISPLSGSSHYRRISTELGESLRWEALPP